MTRKLLIFDFEVFEFNWMIVVREFGTRNYWEFVDDPEGLREFVTKHKDDIHTGFNVKYYDQFILKAILSGINPYLVNEWIITEGKSGWNFKGIKRYKLNFLDLKQDIMGTPGLSLKEVEANLGLHIHECEVPWDIGRPLTEDEIDTVMDYCYDDVDATHDLCDCRWEEYVKPLLLIIKTFGLEWKHTDRTFAQLTALVLGCSSGNYYDEMYYDMPDHIDVKDNRLIEMYQKKPLNYEDQIVINIQGIPHKFKFGGVHAAKKSVFESGLLVHIDVGSYYPTMMLKYNYVSRSLKDTSKFTDIYNTRMRYKAAKAREDVAFRLILQTAFGAMKNRYNTSYDPKQCNQICITGQLMLLDVEEKIEPFGRIIQVNTDGIIMKARNMEAIKRHVTVWEQKTGMTMSYTYGTRIWQKDVNNYIFETEKKLKVKGGWVNNHEIDIVSEGDHYYQLGDKKYSPRMYVRNNASILDKALVQYFVNGTSPEVTIGKCNDLMLYQIITTKKGPNFTHVEMITELDDKTKRYKKSVKVNNVNRIFASRVKNYTRLYKMKKGVPNATPNTPNHCILYNGSMVNPNMSIHDVDKQWYIDQAKDRIAKFVK